MSVRPPPQQRIQALGNALLKLKKHIHIFITTRTIPVSSGISYNLSICNVTDPCLILPWAPQKPILSHSAVRIFISHVGWNSTIESLFSGKPVIGWPLFGDQYQNAAWLEEIGMGVTLPRNPDSNVTDQDIVDAVVEVAGWDTEKAHDSKFKQTAKIVERKSESRAGTFWVKFAGHQELF